MGWEFCDFVAGRGGVVTDLAEGFALAAQQLGEGADEGDEEREAAGDGGGLDGGVDPATPLLSSRASLTAV